MSITYRNAGALRGVVADQEDVPSQVDVLVLEVRKREGSQEARVARVGDVVRGQPGHAGDVHDPVLETCADGPRVGQRAEESDVP
jgi:hypothetical protein